MMEEFFSRWRMQEIGRRCKKIRTDKGLSMRKFAELKKCNLNASELPALEKGNTPITFRQLAAYHRVSGYTFDYLLADENYSSQENADLGKKMYLTDPAINALRHCDDSVLSFINDFLRLVGDIPRDKRLLDYHGGYMDARERYKEHQEWLKKNKKEALQKIFDRIANPYQRSDPSIDEYSISTYNAMRYFASELVQQIKDILLEEVSNNGEEK